MNIKMLKAAFAGLVLSVSGFANAGLIIDFSDSGSDTIITFSGTFDYTGLNVASTENAYWGTGSQAIGSDQDIIRVGSGAVTWGNNGGTTHFELFEAIFSNQVLSNFSGDAFGFWNMVGGGEGNYYRPTSYVSGDSLFSTGTFIGLNVAGLGVNNTGTWKTLSNQETISITVNGATQVPEPTTLAIFALGIFGLASRRFKK
ncbi:MAG: PEP-CTERM sorting domain-containing protein [Colwellia sp.]|nr:PEP-CTERM sorting domain-containing protein [Colwellia sp.]